jgi:glucokinase
MFLAIEIGGTKLQLAVGRGDGSPLAAIERFDVDPAAGADGILRRIHQAADVLLGRHEVSAIGIGFGGPVDAAAGRVVKSHHVAGWEGFGLVRWCRARFDLPAVLGNDAEVAGLAEARFGAGRGKDPVFYVTVGTGIGGGFILDGEIYRGHGLAAAEIGHLRPGPQAETPDEILEAVSAGWGIAAEAQAWIGGSVAQQISPLLKGERPRTPAERRERLLNVEETGHEHAADLLDRAGGQAERITAKLVAQAAADGNEIAAEVMRHAVNTLGWALAQVVTLLSPQAIVVGGGVSLLGETAFFAPLREAVARYVFPPLAGSYEIIPAALGEEVVLHGALALAVDADV